MKKIFSLNKKIFFSTINNKNNSSSSSSSSSSFFSKFSLTLKVKKFIHTLGLTEDEDLSNLIGKSVNIGVYSILTMSFLGTIGFDTKPILAGLGVFGFAAGYALKDAATHFAAGIMLVLQKPFQKGNFLKIMVSTPYEGVVEGIDVRYVHIRTRDQALLLVPCSIVYGNSLIVSSSPPNDWPGNINQSIQSSTPSSTSSTTSTSTSGGSATSTPFSTPSPVLFTSPFASILSTNNSTETTNASSNNEKIK